MKQNSAKNLLVCLLLASNLFSCLSYDKSSSDDDFASDNVIAVDNSINQNSDGLTDADKTPCQACIWKPISESDGNLALIFDEAFPIPFSAVQVNRVVEEETEELAKVEPEFCEFAGFEENGRQVWRCSEPGEAYDGTFIIEYGTEVCEGMVDEPGERHELNASAGATN